MKKILIITMVIIIFVLLGILGLNFYIVYKYDKKIITEEEAYKLKDYCVLILGAGIKNNGPSDMLRDRLIVGSRVYNKGLSKKIIVSGDHSKDNYDEVKVMKNYLQDKFNVPSKDIYKDHYGIATYDSIYRAKEVYGCQKLIIVTQRYHLFRSLYLADKMGIESYGVSASLESYKGQFLREVREVLARDKDFVKGIILPKATYESEALPVSATGDDTNER